MTTASPRRIQTMRAFMCSLEIEGPGSPPPCGGDRESPDEQFATVLRRACNLVGPLRCECTRSARRPCVSIHLWFSPLIVLKRQFRTNTRKYSLRKKRELGPEFVPQKAGARRKDFAYKGKESAANPADLILLKVGRRNRHQDLSFSTIDPSKGACVRVVKTMLASLV